jgi:hypothetical protein
MQLSAANIDTEHDNRITTEQNIPFNLLLAI